MNKYQVQVFVRLDTQTTSHIYTVYASNILHARKAAGDKAMAEFGPDYRVWPVGRLERIRDEPNSGD